MNDLSLNNEIKELIRTTLREDLDEVGDITTNAVIAPHVKGQAIIRSRSEGVLSGLEVVRLVLQTISPDLKLQALISDGQQFERGDQIGTISGPTQHILTAERTVLNFLIFMSGIATRTAQFTAVLKGTKIKILDTRKTVPGTRLISKMAVAAGGGANHRMGLYDMYLVKDNHIERAGGVKGALEALFEHKNDAKKVEVEIDDLAQLGDALAFPIDIVMLDNMSDPEIEEACRVIRDHASRSGRAIQIEISGNIDAERLKNLCLLDIDLISTSKITMQPVPVDIGLDVINESEENIL